MKENNNLEEEKKRRREKRREETMIRSKSMRSERIELWFASIR